MNAATIRFLSCPLQHRFRLPLLLLMELGIKKKMPDPKSKWLINLHLIVQPNKIPHSLGPTQVILILQWFCLDGVLSAVFLTQISWVIGDQIVSVFLHLCSIVLQHSFMSGIGIAHQGIPLCPVNAFAVWIFKPVVLIQNGVHI